MLSFKPTFPLSSLAFIKRLFSSSLSAIMVVSSAYRRLLIFLPAILMETVRDFVFQFSSVAQSCTTLCDPMDCSMPGFPVHYQLLEFSQIHVHRVGDAIQSSHPLSSPFPPAFDLSQHQGLFQGISSFHQVTKVLEFQLQHQSFQWIFRTDFL